MGIITPESLLEQLRWRYATKRFDASRKIPSELWDTLESALVLSPSSYGLQPWKFIVITDPALRARLTPVSWGQKQVQECSHYVVFATKMKIEESDIDEHLNEVARQRDLPIESQALYRKAIVDTLLVGPRSATIGEWARRQAYIALGTLLTSAALLGIDACPMEGIQQEEYDAILDLSAKGFHTVCGCALGYRSADDKYAKLQKVRFSRGKVIERR